MVIYYPLMVISGHTMKVGPKQPKGPSLRQARKAEIPWEAALGKPRVYKTQGSSRREEEAKESNNEAEPPFAAALA